VSEFRAKASQATASEGLAQGPTVAAKARFEPMTLWTKGAESTNWPLCLTYIYRDKGYSRLDFVLSA